MPRIIIMPQVYPPETHPTAVMTNELAEYLVEQGWDVTVCAGMPHHPHGRLFRNWKNARIHRQEINGVKVIRFPHFIYSSRRTAIRAVGYLSQSVSQSAAVLSCRQADVIMVIGPPLIGPNLAASVAKRLRARLVNVIYDIYPDVAMETDRISHPVLTKAATWTERRQYKASALTVVLSDGFKQTLIKKGVDERKIAVVPVWLAGDEIKPGDRNNAWRREQGVSPETFVVLYAGTIGIVSGARMVADAANLLKNERDILFLFVGEGEEKSYVQAAAERASLSNIRFLPFQPRDRLSDVLSSADVCLVTLAKGRARTSVPSKVQAYMAAGKPVIACVDENSDTADAVRTHEMGIAILPDDPDLLAEAILKLKGDRALGCRFGDHARNAFLLTHAKEMVLKRYESLLQTAAEGKEHQAPSASTGSEIQIAPLTREHASFAASLHIQSFDGFFLASLGPGPLCRYYETIVDFGQIGFAATVDNQLVGIVTGIESSFGFYSKLIRRKALSLCLSLVPTIARNPKAAVRIARRLQERLTLSESRQSVSNSVELTSIAVAEEFRGTKTAHRLMDAFKNEALKRGLSRIYLETDASDNERALKFYEKEGFALSRDYRTSEGRQMAELVYDLSDC